MTNRTPQTAREIMHRPVGTADADESVVEAARRLARKGWSGAPVVDSDGTVIGMLSEADVIKGLSAAAFYESPPPTRVRDAMSTPVVSAGPETDLYALVSMTGQGGHKRIPIIEEGRAIGIVTRRDLMKALVAISDARWGRKRVGVLDAIARTEGTHNPFAKSD